MPYRQETEAVLAQWREVERALGDAEPGSQEAEALQSEALRLRDEHQRLIELALEHDQEGLPPLPDPVT